MTSLQSFDLDVEQMSRAVLEKNYFEAVYQYEEITGGDDKTLRLRKFMMSLPRIKSAPSRDSKQTADALSLFLTGRIITHAYLTERIAVFSNRTGANLGGVVICRIRKYLIPLGINIENIWGVGYQMSKQSIARFWAHVEKTEAAQ